MFRFNGFTQRANNAINLGITQAALLGHTYIGSEHLLAGLLREGGSAGCGLLSQKQVTYQRCHDMLTQRIGKGEQSTLTPDDFTPRCKRILENAMAQARAQGSGTVSSDHILAAMLVERECYGVRYLTDMGIDCQRLQRVLCGPSGGGADPGRTPAMGRGAPRPNTKCDNLDKYSRDLTELARLGRLDPVIGRERELDRVIQILARRTKNNPCLIGEAGVGKTAVAEALAQRLAAGTVPDLLQDKRLLSLDLSSMVAGTKYRGDFEERVKNTLEEVLLAGNIILFIDEIHTLVGTGGADGAIDAANILKPQLARGRLQVMGATTLDEYRRYIEKDSALERRFQSVMVEEPSEADAILILGGLRSRYEAHHRLKITDEALRKAVEFSVRYLPDRRLPDKAIDLIDEAASRVRMQGLATKENPQELEDRLTMLRGEMEQAIAARNFEQAAGIRDSEQDLRRRLAGLRAGGQGGSIQVTGEDIAALVAQTTGIDVSTLTKDSSQRLLELETDLHRQVVGQQEAVAAVARAIRRGRVGLRDPRRPVGSFLFLGPTGVGKTKLCRALAQSLFGDENAVLQLDMSEYMERHSVSRLTGSPPGYVGYDDAGQLTERVRRHPYSVVLFDEIEKAHPDIFNLLLQVLEDGNLTDSHGRVVSFRNTVVILTSNVGARCITEQKALGFAGALPQESVVKAQIITELRQTFRPEFLNRIDETIVFTKLSREETAQITRMLLADVTSRMGELGIALIFEDAAVEAIAKAGFDPVMGARPLRRAVQTKVEDLLAGEILRGGLVRGETVRCGWEGDAPKLTKVEKIRA